MESPAIIPAHGRHIREMLKIPLAVWEMLLCDPVMAAYVIMGYRLDAFQAARLRYFWWVPNVIDSSGFSSGKTIVDFIYVCLRAILIPDQEIAVYYPTHSTGKEAFWKYFAECPGEIFQSQRGKLKQDGEKKAGVGEIKSGGTWSAEWLNGNIIWLPAPDIAKDASGQASKRYNVMLIEEWTHIDAKSDAIDAQLVGRTSRESWNKNHPIWCNHITLTAPAKTRTHPAYARYATDRKKVLAGDPDYATLHYSYKDFSRLAARPGRSFRDLFRVDKTIEKLRSRPAAEFLAEGLGIWAINGEGWFTELALTRCMEYGKQRNVLPVTTRQEYEAGQAVPAPNI